MYCRPLMWPALDRRWGGEGRAALASIYTVQEGSTRAHRKLGSDVAVAVTWHCTLTSVESSRSDRISSILNSPGTHSHEATSHGGGGDAERRGLTSGAVTAVTSGAAAVGAAAAEVGSGAASGAARPSMMRLREEENVWL